VNERALRLRCGARRLDVELVIPGEQRQRCWAPALPGEARPDWFGSELGCHNVSLLFDSAPARMDQAQSSRRRSVGSGDINADGEQWRARR
jgi:hypothetical protein